MPRSGPGRVTQRQVAELAGVSQATVSQVLNHAADGVRRIPAETRDRVLRVIAETGYVADPSARRLAGMRNRILGVFTYESAFVRDTQDFYAPLLTGIEVGAEHAGCDLLLFTSAPVTGGRRRLFHEDSRLRLADGVLLLGVEMDPAELVRLAAGGFQVVAAGRRETPGIPYVGVDHAAAAAHLVRRGVELGHRRVLHLHLGGGAESVRDRRAGVLRGVAGSDVALVERVVLPDEVDVAWAAVRANRPTLVVVEPSGLAAALVDRARAAGVDVPGELSVVGLGAPVGGPVPSDGPTRLDPPRTELGRRAATLLARIVAGDPPGPDELRVLLDCPVTEGRTLAAAPR